jgi:hypothetical protein
MCPGTKASEADAWFRYLHLRNLSLLVSTKMYYSYLSATIGSMRDARIAGM